MKKAVVLTAWGKKAVPGGLANFPQVAIDYRLASWRDGTNQPSQNIPPSPNLFACEIVCDDAVMVAIAADVRYPVLHGDDKPAKDAPAGDYTALRTKLGSMGATKADIDAAVGAAVPATRQALADKLLVWLAARPKA